MEGSASGGGVVNWLEIARDLQQARERLGNAAESCSQEDGCLACACYGQPSFNLAYSMYILDCRVDNSLGGRRLALDLATSLALSEAERP